MPEPADATNIAPLATAAGLGVAGGYTGPLPILDGWIVAIIVPVVVVVSALVSLVLFKTGPQSRASKPKDSSSSTVDTSVA